MVPLVTVIFGFIVMGDRLTFLQWIGAALVIGGVYLSMLQSRSNTNEKLKIDV
jgi:drug/metabolite transporter (DMT)-like permease